MKHEKLSLFEARYAIFKFGYMAETLKAAEEACLDLSNKRLDEILLNTGARIVFRHDLPSYSDRYELQGYAHNGNDINKVIASFYFRRHAQTSMSPLLDM